MSAIYLVGVSHFELCVTQHPVSTVTRGIGSAVQTLQATYSSEKEHWVQQVASANHPISWEYSSNKKVTYFWKMQTSTNGPVNETKKIYWLKVIQHTLNCTYVWMNFTSFSKIAFKMFIKWLLKLKWNINSKSQRSSFTRHLYKTRNARTIETIPPCYHSKLPSNFSPPLAFSLSLLCSI